MTQSTAGSHVASISSALPVAKDASMGFDKRNCFLAFSIWQAFRATWNALAQTSESIFVPNSWMRPDRSS